MGRARLPLSLAAAALCCFAGLALADWPPGGLLVTGLGDAPRVVADGSGGAIVAWTQLAAPTGLFAQRYTATGEVAPGWPAEGVVVSNATSLLEGMVTDGAGGAYLLWTVGTPADSARLMLGRVGATGTIPAGWAIGGRAVTNGPGQMTARLVADGAGAAIVVWRDRRASVGLGASICGQKILGSGANASGFSALGRVIVSRMVGGAETFQYPELAPDPSGGWWLTYVTVPASSGPTPIQVTRLAANLARTPDWQLPDLVLADASPYPVTVQAPVASDGAGGAYVAVPLSGLRLHHVLSTPEEDPTWPAGGAVVDTPVTVPSTFFAGDESFPLLAGDGEGGVYVVWDPITNQAAYPKLFAQRWRADASVAPGWNTPLPVAGTLHANVVSTAGGLFASGERMWQCSHFICQRDGFIDGYRADGTQSSAWTTPPPPSYPFPDGPGQDLVWGPMNSGGARLADDGAGGVFAAFRLGEMLSPSLGVRLARFAVDGPVAGVAPSVPAGLALRAPRAGGGVVRFTLVTRVAGPVDLGVFDVAGRRLARATFDAPAGFTGEVSVRSDPGEAGLVFVRARQGAATATARLPVLR